MKVRIALLMLVLGVPAAARDNGQWVNSPSRVREWFQSAPHQRQARVASISDRVATVAEVRNVVWARGESPAGTVLQLASTAAAMSVNGRTR